MNRPSLPTSTRPARLLVWAVSAIAGLAGAWFSYGFGLQIGGILFGVIAALNGALMGSVLASSILERLMPRLASRD